MSIIMFTRVLQVYIVVNQVGRDKSMAMTRAVNVSFMAYFRRQE